jgi:hypothetical protein
VSEDRPLFLIRGGATEEEVAALLAVLHGVAASAPAGRAPRTAPAAWAAPHRMVRGTHRHGPGGWRASGLPR